MKKTTKLDLSIILELNDLAARLLLTTQLEMLAPEIHINLFE